VSDTVDLRSDTVTLPTPAMLRAMGTAPLGDDVYGEDPTVRALEEQAAAALGKEAALFLPTGTMGNQVAVLTHTLRGAEVVVDLDSHIFDAEVGGLAVLAGVQTRPLKSRAGVLDAREVEAAIRPEDVHYPRTGLICVENPHNSAGGLAAPPAAHAGLRSVARDAGLPLHLDGARIFNAAVALGVPAPDLARPFDSVMFCLSKSLCCPVGSVLAGAVEFIGRARHNRKMLGGGMRQAGVLAAAGLVALDTMIDRLAEDHEKAQSLAAGLAALPGLTLDPGLVQTNMVFVRVGAPTDVADRSGGGARPFAAAFCRALGERGVLAGAVGPERVRFVTHKDVDAGGIRRCIEAAGDVMRTL
jgi:threonine aldolase